MPGGQLEGHTINRGYLTRLMLVKSGQESGAYLVFLFDVGQSITVRPDLDLNNRFTASFLGHRSHDDAVSVLGSTFNSGSYQIAASNIVQGV